MACINVTSIIVKDNPASLFCPLKFLITFEALTSLKEDLEWRIIYVGDKTSNIAADHNSSSHLETQPPEEIELDCVALGPIKRGVLSFEFAVKPPDFSQMDPDSILGMQAVLVTASYRKNEFIRIGYFLNNMYIDPALRGVPPIQPQLDKMVRCIIDDMPRVTRYPIHWDEPNRELVTPEDAENSLINENNSYGNETFPNHFGISQPQAKSELFQFPIQNPPAVTKQPAPCSSLTNDSQEDVEMLA